jgi:hypothetical protein
LQGILTVTVIRARGLTGWQHEADPYVTLALMETAGEASDSKATAGARTRLSMLQEQRSKTVYNEESPRSVVSAMQAVPHVPQCKAMQAVWHVHASRGLQGSTLAITK